jgi:hypothetical protein
MELFGASQCNLLNYHQRISSLLEFMAVQMSIKLKSMEFHYWWELQV